MPRDLQIPNADDLLNRTPAQLLALLKTYGIEPDLAGMEAEADRVIERVLASLRAGVELDAAAWASIDRQIELAVEGVVRRQIKDVVRSYREAKLRPVRSFPRIWLAVMDKNTCPSCDARHGLVKPLAYWDRVGHPGDPSLVCDGECRCQELPMPNEAGVDPYVELEAYV